MPADLPASDFKSMRCLRQQRLQDTELKGHGAGVWTSNEAGVDGLGDLNSVPLPPAAQLSLDLCGVL